jgi:hypothetical protein
LPDFLVIGAAKAGTTWLVSCLRRHPDVFIPLEEIHYWTRNLEHRDGVHSWYGRMFRDARRGQLVGENSNSYLMQPDAAELIARDLPGVKLVAILRNPIERAYSSYCMRLRYGDVSRDIFAWLDPAGPDETELVSSSLYCQKLQPYLARFPRSQLHFALFDDIATSPETLLDALCQFLGIEPRAGDMEIADRVNARDKHWPLPAVHRAYARSAALRGLNRGIRGSWLHARIRALLSRPVVYPAFPDALRARLADYYRDDVARLAEIIGRDLSAWLTTGGAGERAVTFKR